MSMWKCLISSKHKQRSTVIATQAVNQMLHFIYSYINLDCMSLEQLLSKSIQLKAEFTALPILTNIFCFLFSQIFSFFSFFSILVIGKLSFPKSLVTFL